MASLSPTQRTLAYLKSQGYLCQVVEKWNPHARIRQDLYGFIDILAIKEDEVLGVQACAGSSVSARVKKIAEHDNISAVRKAGIKVWVMGWRKLKTGWSPRIEDLS